MTIQNYLIVESNVVINSVLWDGNTQTWAPPANSIQLVQATTPTMVWEAVVVDNKITDFVLTNKPGLGGIGFTWDGSVLTTDEAKPPIPDYTQPTSTGTQTL